VCGIDCAGFVFLRDRTNLSFVKLTDSLNPIVQVSFSVDKLFDPHIHVYGKKLSGSHELWKHLPQPPVCNSKYSIEIVLGLLGQMTVCCGVKSDKLITLVSHANCEALGAELSATCSKEVHSLQCILLLFTGERCIFCGNLRKKLLMRRCRLQKSSTIALYKAKKRNSYLTSPIKRAKLRQLARKSQSLNKSVCKLKSQLALFKKQSSKCIAAHGEKLNDTDCDEMLQLARGCKGAIATEFPPGSFQRIFFDQQVKFNALKTKAAMRWHPAIIRWCLYIRSRSAKAYDGIRAFLRLPSNRTLYDYTHYMEQSVGLNPKTTEQLISKAASLGCFSVQHKSYVGLLQDEMKIKANLVYHKNGELVGFVHLDNVSNELMKIEKLADGETELAESLLVVMVRGITTPLRYPLAAYATRTLSSSTLYNVMWECVECLEVVVGLRVLFICCDGASQNRKYFNLHSADEITFKTKNLYALDDRDIYFISDPPHLLKTARNCFANSYAHSKTRCLWFDQDISWTHVSKLFHEHCEMAEYRLCPKLTRNHVNLTSFSKMSVSIAAQVFSNSVANALEHVWGSNVSSTVKFVRIMNKWFDIVNVKHLYEGKNSRNGDLVPFTSVDDARLEWLDSEFLEYLHQWTAAAESRQGKFSKKQRQQMQLSKQTIDGFKITSRSVAAVIRHVLQNGAPFVLTSHLNQDPLEQLFGHCRHKGGSNDNPNVAEACNSINTIRSVSTQAVCSQHGNTKAVASELDFTPVPKRTRERCGV